MSHVFDSAFYHVSFCRDSSGGIPAGMGAHLILVVQDALLVLGMLWIYDAQEALQAKMALVEVFRRFTITTCSQTPSPLPVRNENLIF